MAARQCKTARVRVPAIARMDAGGVSAWAPLPASTQLLPHQCLKRRDLRRRIQIECLLQAAGEKLKVLGWRLGETGKPGKEMLGWEACPPSYFLALLEMGAARSFPGRMQLIFHGHHS